jgi:hypothetical protein
MAQDDLDWRIAIMRYQFRQGYLTPGIQFLADDRHGDGPPFWVDSCTDPFVLYFDTIPEAMVVLRDYPEEAVLTCVNLAGTDPWGAAGGATGCHG